MSNINQGNFNIKVEKEVEEIAIKLIKVLSILVFSVLFVVLLLGAITDTKITQNIVLLSITPIAVIGLISRIYIGTILKSKIELKLANSIGYNKAQMNKVLKNPNYREHTPVY